MVELPTLKQKALVAKMIDYFGKDYCKDYLTKFYAYADIDNLTKAQAQKLITGNQHFLPSKPLYGVYGRDVF